MRRTPGKPISPKRTERGRTAALRSGESAKRSREYQDFIEPCRQRDSPPSGGNSVYEIKADGYRALQAIDTSFRRVSSVGILVTISPHLQFGLRHLERLACTQPCRGRPVSPTA
jgi:hypothetical protein